MGRKNRIHNNHSLLICSAAIAPPLPLLSPPSPDISAANIAADICLCVLPFTVHCRPLLLSAFFLSLPFNAGRRHH
jgi:hypothetical protein